RALDFAGGGSLTPEIIHRAHEESVAKKPHLVADNPVKPLSKEERRMNRVTSGKFILKEDDGKRPRLDGEGNFQFDQANFERNFGHLKDGKDREEYVELYVAAQEVLGAQNAAKRMGTSFDHDWESAQAMGMAIMTADRERLGAANITGKTSVGKTAIESISAAMHRLMSLMRGEETTRPNRTFIGTPSYEVTRQSFDQPHLIAAAEGVKGPDEKFARLERIYFIDESGPRKNGRPVLLAYDYESDGRVRMEVTGKDKKGNIKRKPAMKTVEFPEDLNFDIMIGSYHSLEMLVYSNPRFVEMFRRLKEKDPDLGNRIFADDIQRWILGEPLSISGMESFDRIEAQDPRAAKFLLNKQELVRHAVEILRDMYDKDKDSVVQRNKEAQKAGRREWELREGVDEDVIQQLQGQKYNQINQKVKDNLKEILKALGRHLTDVATADFYIRVEDRNNPGRTGNVVYAERGRMTIQWENEAASDTRGYTWNDLWVDGFSIGHRGTSRPEHIYDEATAQGLFHWLTLNSGEHNLERSMRIGAEYCLRTENLLIDFSYALEKLGKRAFVAFSGTPLEEFLAKVGFKENRPLTAQSKFQDNQVRVRSYSERPDQQGVRGYSSIVEEGMSTILEGIQPFSAKVQASLEEKGRELFYKGEGEKKEERYYRDKVIFVDAQEVATLEDLKRGFEQRLDVQHISHGEKGDVVIIKVEGANPQAREAQEEMAKDLIARQQELPDSQRKIIVLLINDTSAGSNMLKALKEAVNAVENNSQAIMMSVKIIQMVQKLDSYENYVQISNRANHEQEYSPNSPDPMRLPSFETVFFIDPDRIKLDSHREAVLHALNNYGDGSAKLREVFLAATKAQSVHEQENARYRFEFKHQATSDERASIIAKIYAEYGSLEEMNFSDRDPSGRGFSDSLFPSFTGPEGNIPGPRGPPEGSVLNPVFGETSVIPFQIQEFFPTYLPLNATATQSLTEAVDALEGHFHNFSQYTPAERAAAIADATTFLALPGIFNFGPLSGDVIGLSRFGQRVLDHASLEPDRPLVSIRGEIINQNNVRPLNGQVIYDGELYRPGARNYYAYKMITDSAAMRNGNGSVNQENMQNQILNQARKLAEQEQGSGWELVPAFLPGQDARGNLVDHPVLKIIEDTVPMQSRTVG
ncbi:MAG TPA: hypothetical protein VJA17_00375, partial [Candidatus Omnitrophota bacterium]|nr:hypothetical protein [Candidatus Omnitrophota bacterium]